MVEFRMYSENDILFTKKQFDYWIEYKDVLKEENLEPGFCRVEKVKDKFIPLSMLAVYLFIIKLNFS